MNSHYSSERNVQMLISLMKAHGIRNIVASPGTTNIAFVASVQQDSFFQIYSSVDERSAAYMACGLAGETGEPVALSCTGATASRNYVSGLTEAFYRKLPVLAITSTQHTGRVGQLIPQVIDRTSQMKDIVRMSVQVPTIHCAEDAWSCNTHINEALLELRHNGGGPVHINLQTEYSPDFSVRELPTERVIQRFELDDALPPLPKGKIGIFIGSHKPISKEFEQIIESFCAKADAVVLCDQTSNYRGAHRVLAALVTNQDNALPECATFDLLIHIGEVSGAYLRLSASQVWRVNPDGAVRDTFKKLTAIFQMSEERFFASYAASIGDHRAKTNMLSEWVEARNKIEERIPELPFSNLWIASKTMPLLPDGCILHLGILNSLRSWNMFEGKQTIRCYSNTGGFGIDGGISSLIGASLANKENLYFGVFGDLAFFYDMNALGNRHIQPNIRILLVNNGRGTEFRNYSHPAARFGEDADAFMAAAGHFGNKSPELVKHYATDLGFKYISASNKAEYLELLPEFVSANHFGKPILFEVFTDSESESEALEQISNLEIDAKGIARKAIKRAFGQKGVDTIKAIVGR